MTGTRVAAVVPAAGLGTRFGSAENKIWARVCGRAIIDWTLSALDSHPEIDAIVVAGNPAELDRFRAAVAPFGKVAKVVPGGRSRQESVANALAALPADSEVVLVHDAARPAPSHALISRILAETWRRGAAIPGLPVTDTLKRTDSGGAIQATVARDSLWAVQTPQGARVDLLKAAYQALGSRVCALTDEAGVLEAAGYAVHVVPGEESNLKITRQADLERAAFVLAAKEQGSAGSPGHGSLAAGDNEAPDSRATQSPNEPMTQRPNDPMRVGFGYDVHPFAQGRELWLGGVNIPHDRGLAGHSDADALLHAICDALLGAAGLGDIGVLFPDTDRAHKDRSSIEFLEQVRRLLESSGWRVVNVDVSLLAEAPRIGPHRAEMSERVASALRVTRDCVNIKATTSERLGFVGRQEGIACWAVATITAL